MHLLALNSSPLFCVSSMVILYGFLGILCTESMLSLASIPKRLVCGLENWKIPQMGVVYFLYFCVGGMKALYINMIISWLAVIFVDDDYI